LAALPAPGGALVGKLIARDDELLRGQHAFLEELGVFEHPHEGSGDAREDVVGLIF